MIIKFSMIYISSLGGQTENNDEKPCLFIFFVSFLELHDSGAIMLNCNITKMAYFPLILNKKVLKLS